VGSFSAGFLLSSPPGLRNTPPITQTPFWTVYDGRLYP